MTPRRLPGTLYVAVEEGGPSKIGVAVQPEARVKVVARQCERPVRLVWSAPYADCRRAETLVCLILRKHRHPGFRVEGNSEWFDVPPERVIAAARRAMSILDRKDKAALRRLRVGAYGPRQAPPSIRAHGDKRAQTLETIAALEGLAE